MQRGRFLPAKNENVASPYVFATGQGANSWYESGVSNSVLNSKHMTAARFAYFT
jgi:hypothetical protein